MKIQTVFFLEAITFPGTQFSGIVSINIDKGFGTSLEWDKEWGGVVFSTRSEGGFKSVFIPSSNIRSVVVIKDGKDDKADAKAA